MKILHLAPGFTPEVGSMRIHHELAKGLVKAGDEVVIITTYPRSYNLPAGFKPVNYNRKKVTRERIDGIDVVRFPTMFLGKVRGIFGYVIEQVFVPLSLFFGSFAAGKCDILYSTIPPQGTTFAAIILAKLRRIPFVCTVHDLHPKILVDMGLLKNIILIKILEILEKFLYRHANYLGVNSKGNRKYIIEKGVSPDKVSVLPQWADLDLIHISSKQNAIRKEIGKKFILSFAGIMSYPQDLESIIEAAAHFQNNPDIAFLMVGDGPKAPIIKKRARELGLKNVIFWPLQQKEKYFQILAASDVSFVPLTKDVPLEQVPSKLLEVMGSARPVILNAPRGDAAKILEQSEGGYQVFPGDIKRLVEIIQDLYSNPQKCEQMGMNGRKFVEENYSLEKCTQIFRNAFKKTLSKGPER